MRRRIGFILSVALLLGSLGAIGYWLLFSNFAVYDDEGYILISVREYLAHGRLYEMVYSQYGPAFYVLLDCFQRLLGAPVDHTSARLLTLGLWLGNAGCCALLVWRQTASRSLTLFTLAATFLYLYYIMDEPFHPGSLIFFLLALSLWLAAGLIRSGRLAGAAAVAGGTGAVLLLTKVNVGALYVVGVGAWAVLQAAPARTRRIALPLVVAALVLLAAGLMKSLLGQEPWVQIYLVLFAVGAVTVSLAQRGEVLVKVGTAVWFALTGLSVGLVILAIVWLRGTSLSGLVEGVLLGPLRHPVNYSYPVDWRPGSLLVAGLSLLLALAYPWLCRRFSEATGARIVVLLRLVVFGAVLTGFALLLEFRAVGAIFSYVAPLIWIWVIPLTGIKPASTASAIRGLLAMILLLQFLHAYPVGGSQESWGTFLFLPLAALGLGEVREWFARHRPAPARPGRWWPALAFLTVIVVIGKVGYTARVEHAAYAARSDLGLPGAANLRLPAEQRGDYRILTLNAAVHADVLFSLPGMFSFNLWTDRPTPTGKNTTLWFSLLNDREQQAIVQALAQSPRAAIIVQESLVQLMQDRGIAVTGLLQEYLHANFTAAFKLDGFAFLVRTGREIAPLNIAELRVRPDPDSTGRRPDTQLDFCLINDGPPITTIEVDSGTAASANRLILDGSNSELTVTVIDSSGRARALPEKTAWPLRRQGLARVSVDFHRGAFSPAPHHAVFYLKGANGEVLDEVRLGD